MKNLVVRWADGQTAAYTVPDDFTLYPDGRDRPTAPLRVHTPDLELWVDDTGLKSVMLVSDTLGSLTRLPDQPTTSQTDPNQSFNR